MAISSRSLLSIILTFLLLINPASLAQTFPATVEFDVVFPRNDSYAPTALMPIVFAIQNPVAAVSLGFSIHWELWRSGNDEEKLEDHSEVLNTATTPAANPYFIIRYTDKLNNTEGNFLIWWQLKHGNCSSSDANWQDAQQSWSKAYNATDFSIAKDSQQPSLITGLDTCSTQSVAYNVTGTVLMPGGDCAVLAGQSPPVTPCAININATLASSISAFVTSSACQGSPSSLRSICSIQKGTAARSSLRETVWMGLAAISLSAFIVWVM